MFVEFKNSDIIDAKDLKDGDIAIIIDWNTNVDLKGTIIQRTDDKLIMIGKPTSEYFNWKEVNMFRENGTLNYHYNYKVRKLKPGDKICL